MNQDKLSEDRLGISRIYTALLYSFLFSLATAAGHAEEAGPISCNRVELDVKMGWMTSAAWAAEGDRATLFAADVSRDLILEFSTTGRMVGSLGGFTKEEDGPFTGLIRPSSVKPVGRDGFAVKDEATGEIVRLLKDRRRATEVVAKKGPIERIYDWVPLKDGVLAFADLKTGNQYRNGFVYVDSSTTPEVFLQLGQPLGNPKRERPAEKRERHRGKYHYLFAYPAMATIGDIGYILLLHEKNPRVIKVEPEKPGFEEVIAASALPGNRPRLEWDDRWAGLKRRLGFLRSLESTSAPMALYSYESLLYILVKSEMNNRATDWFFHIFDADGKPVDEVRLPTQAGHLAVAPGSTFAFFEQRPVKWLEVGLQGQGAPYVETHSLVLADSSLLRERPFLDRDCAVSSR